MRGRWGRWRPNVRKLAGRQDIAGLLKALDYRDGVVDARDRLYDLGVPVRRDAARALAVVPQTDGLDVGSALVTALGDPFAEVRAAAAASLGARGDSRALGALFELAITETDRDTVHAAHEWLLKLSAVVASLEPIVDVLMRHASSRASVAALVRTMARASGDGATRDAAVAATHALGLGDPGRSAGAEDLLVWLGPASVGPLLDALGRDGDGRVNAVSALGRLGDLRAAPALADLLGDPEGAVRSAAAAALARLPDPSAYHALVPLTVDPDPVVRATTLEALQRLGPPPPPRAVDAEQRLASGVGRLPVQWPSGHRQ